MNSRSRLRHQAASETEATANHAHGPAPAPAGNAPEELLRTDRANTPVPPTVTRRLAQSLGNLPAPRPVSWWRRIFGRS